MNTPLPYILVVGSGISGMRAALDLADADCKVYLVEKSPAIGGILTQLDHQFPNNHCGMCRLLPMINCDAHAQFCLRKGLHHENITILASTEVESITGTPGHLTVKLRQMPQGVEPQKCTGCNECECVCPVTVTDVFNAGLAERKAIYQPVPYHYHHTRVIDWDACTRCQACVDACPHGAVNLEQESKRLEMKNITSVLIATGSQLFDPGSVDLYGFGALPNVVTATAFERILSSSGPFQGRPIRPSDLKPLEKIAWVQCVGSRNIMIGADYCSSACCMFAVKEAILAHQKIGQGAQTTLFYMDMRTFGRDFQRYRDRAEKLLGIRFVRCRVHSIEPAESAGDLRLGYIDIGGNYIDDVFDMVVLSTGQRPNQTLPDYAHIEGVFVVDDVQNLKDISESVINAGVAAGKVLQMIRQQGFEPARPSAEEKLLQEAPLFAKKPSFHVILDTCLEKEVQWSRIEKGLLNLPGHVAVSQINGLCGSVGWQELEQCMQQPTANRLILATGNPDAVWLRIKKSDKGSHLIPSTVELVDLQKLVRGESDATHVAGTIIHEIEMKLNMLRDRRPRESWFRSVEKTALVVGGGPAGLSAAHALAAYNLSVVLVETKDYLGGNLTHIYRPDLKQSIENLLSDVEHHPQITIYKGAEISATSGRVGQFSTRVRLNSGREEIIRHGVTIIATGGRPAETDAFHLGSNDRIITQFEMERRIYDSEFCFQGLNSLVMIQCAGSREEPQNYCSRICCIKTLNNALRIKELYPDSEITIFYRDMMTYGESEKIYTEARRKGIFFIPFDLNSKPEIQLESGDPVVIGSDPILGTSLCFHPDLIVLGVGVVPNPTEGLARIFSLDLTQDGFVKEADSNWRPVDTGKEGIFVAGMARGPVRGEEAMREGQAAAYRALGILTKDVLISQRRVARVRHAICSKCELCIETCPYSARYVAAEDGKIVVDHAVCQGCGACAALCPNSATIIGDFEDNSIMDAIEAAF